MNEILAEPEMKAQPRRARRRADRREPEEFGKIVEAETEKWEKIVKFAGARVE